MNRHEGFHEFVLARQQALMRTAYLLIGDAHRKSSSRATLALPGINGEFM
ncbi:hypothetical protein ACBI99_18630 [Nonomuraea sp. ATR24]|nr:hypothetical protein [Nonomuraea ceibae]